MIIVYNNRAMEIRFAHNLAVLRESWGLRQVDLALKLGTTQRRISYWESGKIEPDLESLWRIADFFQISVDELIGRSD